MIIKIDTTEKLKDVFRWMHVREMFDTHWAAPAIRNYFPISKELRQKLYEIGDDIDDFIDGPGTVEESKEFIKKVEAKAVGLLAEIELPVYIEIVQQRVSADHADYCIEVKTEEQVLSDPVLALQEFCDVGECTVEGFDA